MDNCPGKQFKSPIMVTVKKQQPAKPALDAKKEQIHHKNKYHMPNEERTATWQSSTGGEITW